MGSYRFHAEKPVSLLSGVTDPRSRFETIWAQLPRFARGSAWACPAADPGLFIKGQIEPFNLWPKRLVRRYRILREYRKLIWMRNLGLPVPDVFAWGAEYRWGLPVRTLLLMEKPVGAIDMQARLLASSLESGSRANLFRALGECVGRLHAAKVAHRDLYLRNILTMPRSSQQKLLFIDCPGAEHRRFWLRGAYLRRSDLYSLVRDGMKLDVPEQDLVLFLRAAGYQSPDTVIQHARRAHLLDRVRPFRSNLWLMFGI